MTGVPSAAPRLNISDRMGRRVVSIDKSPFTIGRSNHSDVRVFSSEVSREHAEIVADGDRFLLRDCASRYGTFVNGQIQTEHVLVDGDRIRLGRNASVEIIFLNLPDDATTGASLVGVVRQTAALLEGLRALGAAHLLQDVLVLVLDAAIDVSGAERGFIMLANPDGALEFTLARARGQIPLAGQMFKTSQKIPREVFDTGESRIVRDLVEGDEAGDHAATLAFGIRQVLCVPLRLLRYIDQAGLAPEARRIGVLYLDGRESGTLLSPATRIGVETLATEAALAIENARLYRESLEKARVDQELRIAAEMQRALRPASRHRGADFEIAAASESSRSIGGDFVDYLELPGEAFGLALGDVSGKGPAAAVLAAALQGMFAAYATTEIGPGETLTRMNLAMARHLVTDRFATMVYGVLRPGGRLTYSIAGHNPPMLFTGGGIRRLEWCGLPLGLFEEAEFPERTLQLQTGDVLVLFSDGVSEASNGTSELFGDERIISSVRANLDADAATLLARLFEAAHDFSRVAVPADDVTALVLRYLG